MNILFEKLPVCAELEGKSYALNTCFKNWIAAQHLLSCESADIYKTAKALALCYKKRLPPNIALAKQGILQFYGGAFEKTGSGGSTTHTDALFDFYYDASYIYSDFMRIYGIDLTRCDMHWYKFVALFSSLGEEGAVGRAVRARGMDLSLIKDERTRSFYARRKRLFRLRTNGDTQQSFNRQLNTFF